MLKLECQTLDGRPYWLEGHQLGPVAQVIEVEDAVAGRMLKAAETVTQIVRAGKQRTFKPRLRVVAHKPERVEADRPDRDRPRRNR